MNKQELRDRILSDSHREDYAGIVDSFIAEGEAFIAVHLEAYSLEYTLTDADRIEAAEPVYNLPPRTKFVRHLLYKGCPLDEVDEKSISQYRTLNAPLLYAVRPLTVVVAGNPPPDAELSLHYFGLPAPLIGDTDTNTLLNNCPQLYRLAAQIYLFKRTGNFAASEDAERSALGLIDNLNRQIAKQIGGGRSANPYNVDIRSSY